MKRHSKPTIERMKALLDYDPLTGKFHQKASGKCGFIPYSEVGSKTHPSGYIFLTVDGQSISAQSAAWAITYGEWPLSTVDHEDRDKSNNRIKNLRLATFSQSTINTVRPSAMGVRGVRMCKGKPQAAIKKDGKRTHLGTFGTLDEAAHAYNKAAIALHGEFAVLNPFGADKVNGAAGQKGGA